MSEPTPRSQPTDRDDDGASRLETTLAQQRMRWRSGSGVFVEEIFSQDDALRNDHDAALDLLYNEVLLRRERGDIPTRQEYCERFPHLSASLSLLFDVDEGLEGEGQRLSVDVASLSRSKNDFGSDDLTSSRAPTVPASPGATPSGSEDEVKYAPQLVASNSFRGTVELHTMLQRRLRFLSILLTVLYLQAGSQLHAVWHMEHWRYYRLHMSLVWAVLGIVASIATYLILRRSLVPLHWLRILELILFICPIAQTSCVLFDLTWLQGDLFRILSMPGHDTAYLFHTMVLFYFPSITGYGILIPNTGRRCLMVTLCMAMVPVVVLVAGLPLVPEVWREYRYEYLQGLSWVVMWEGVGVACASYGCHRINVLQVEAFVARRLGQYRLRERLGAGGMGEVYLAEHVLLKQPCAVKIIRRERAGDPDALRRFEREVRATARLKHWNTVTIFDYGIAADGTFYYAMEYLPGLNLEEMVGRHGPLPPARACYFLRQACAALREAHGIGLIHRDIKPANLIVCERGGVHDVVKVLDFGLVRNLHPGRDSLTETANGIVAGTPAYMSPEQAGGANNVDARSDIYGLGAVAYFLLTGQPPFADRTQIEVLAAHLYESPRPVGELAPDVPVELCRIVTRCLAKQPLDRFQDVQELEEALCGVGAPDDWSATDARQWWLSQDVKLPSTSALQV